MAITFYSEIRAKALNFINRNLIGPIVRLVFLRLKLQEKFRVLNTNSAAIGHLCADVDCFLRERELYNFPFRGVLLANKNRVCNIVLSRLWKSHPGICLIENPLVCYLLDYLRVYAETSFDCSDYIAIPSRPAKAFSVYKKYNGVEPLINWDERAYEDAKSTFKKLFPHANEDKIVVLHCRDSYYDQITNNPNFLNQKYRNCDIKSYESILNFLNNSGYDVIRIGKYKKDVPDSGKNYLEIKGVSQYESQLLDIYLSSNCVIFLGCQSGPANIPGIWNRPSFALNILSYESLGLRSKCSMSVPKLLSVENNILTVNEIFDRGFHKLSNDADYAKHNIVFHMNQPKDVLDDFKEFF